MTIIFIGFIMQFSFSIISANAKFNIVCGGTNFNAVYDGTSFNVVCDGPFNIACERIPIPEPVCEPVPEPVPEPEPVCEPIRNLAPEFDNEHKRKFSDCEFLEVRTPQEPARQFKPFPCKPFVFTPYKSF